MFLVRILFSFVATTGAEEEVAGRSSVVSAVYPERWTILQTEEHELSMYIPSFTLLKYVLIVHNYVWN